MPIGPASSTPVCFGHFEVDLKSGELRKQGVRVKLQDQPLQILQMLLEQPGQVVTREELQQRLWPSDTFVDFDHGLYNAVKRLREALGDVADTPRFIETVPKRGYRFIAPATRNGFSARMEQRGNRSDSAPPISTGEIQPEVSKGKSKNRLKLVTAVCTLVLILGALVLFNVGGVRSGLLAPNGSPQIHSLAVLPLKNLSDDPAQEYFSYGMTEELITDLAQISGLKVISHTSVLQYANTRKTLPQICGELGVDGIVEGTVQRSGDRVRITAQLIYAPRDQHLWAGSYDRDLRDALTLQSSVAAAIVEPIRSKTALAGPGQRKNQTSSSVQAMEDYLQGNYLMGRIGEGDGYEAYKAAIQYFKQAISEDPDFAPAYLGLISVYENSFAMSPNQTMPLERAALAKALELDPGSAEAHQRRAAIMWYYDCDPTGAESEFKEALRLNPNLAEAHGEFSDFLNSIGRHEESIQEAQRAEELDPVGVYGIAALVSDGQYDRAVEKLRRYLELHPKDGGVYIGGDPAADTGLIDVYHFAGRHRESIDALQRAWTMFGFKEIGEGVGRAYADSGYAGALRYSAKQMEHLYAEGTVWEPQMIASWYARVPDKEQSLKWLRVYLTDTNNCWEGLDRVPDFVSFHSDPRFQDLVKRAAAH